MLASLANFPNFRLSLLLPIDEQESVYSLIESDYQELMQRAQAMGDSNLEAGQLGASHFCDEYNYSCCLTSFHPAA